MNERAVRAAVERVTREAHGLFMGTGEECRMVPVDALAQLVEALDAEPDELPTDVQTDRSSVT